MTAAGRSHRPAPQAPGLNALRERLWDAIASRDENAAIGTVLDEVDSGTDPEQVLVDVVARIQHRVGAEWAANRWSVAQEHAATAINDRVVAALAHHTRGRAPAPLGRVIVACVDGEWHAMPARLLAEVLTLRGWQVDYLGAQVPATHLIAHIHRTGPDVVALSSSIPTRLPAAHAMITACQATGTPVLAGGAAFGPDGRYARLLGADGWAPDASAAADRLAAGLDPPGSHQPSGELSHLTDGEHAQVTRSAVSLVKGTLAGLDERFPAMRAYTEQQRQHTVQDLAHIVDFLAAALYVDDDALFTRFLTWTADILTARGVPGESLLLGLELLAGQLSDLPRATRLIERATQALDDHIGGTRQAQP